MVIFAFKIICTLVILTKSIPQKKCSFFDAYHDYLTKNRKFLEYEGIDLFYKKKWKSCNTLVHFKLFVKDFD
eukprot:UN21676